VTEQHPDLRASDADREAVAKRLHAAGADGRLDPQELEERLERCYAAKTFGELDRLTADLGPSAPAAAPAPAPSGGEDGMAPWGNWKLRWGSWAATSVLLVGIWAITCIASGDLQYFWPVWPIGFWALGNVAASIAGWGQGGGQKRRQ